MVRQWNVDGVSDPCVGHYVEQPQRHSPQSGHDGSGCVARLAACDRERTPGEMHQRMRARVWINEFPALPLHQVREHRGFVCIVLIPRWFGACASFLGAVTCGFGEFGSEPGEYVGALIG